MIQRRFVASIASGDDAFAVAIFRCFLRYFGPADQRPVIDLNTLIALPAQTPSRWVTVSCHLQRPDGDTLRLTATSKHVPLFKSVSVRRSSIVTRQIDTRKLLLIGGSPFPLVDCCRILLVQCSVSASVVPQRRIAAEDNCFASDD